MLTDTSYLIANVGFMVVVSAVFIILFYRQYTQLQNFQASYIKKLEDTDNHKIQQHNTGIEIRMNAANKVNSLIQTLAANSGASRSYILELHNSANNFTGLPFTKFSMTYEYFAPGKHPIIHNYQNLSASTLAGVVFKLYDDTHLFIKDTEHVTDYQTLAWFMIERDAKAILMLPLKDSNSKIFGLAGFDFDDSEHIADWDWEFIQDKFQADVARIAGYLDFQR